MIYLDTRAGLCNRMRAIASAYDLAKKYNTSLVVYWPLNKALNCNFYDLFEPIPGITVNNTRYICKLKRKIRSYKFKSSKRFLNIKMDNCDEVEQLLRKGENVYIYTVHQFSNVNEYNIFRVCKNVEDKISSILPSNIDELKGIHIRRTDNTKSIENSPTELFINAINQELIHNPNTVFFCASDSIQEEERLSDIFGSKIIFNKNKSFSRNSPKGIKDALVDLCCLKKCNEIYGSYWSSFSETAALWGGGKLHILVKSDSDYEC